ncbi:diacylglycerol kinase [Neptunomonas phycophila]|uniref:Diacylglycerol kinase n=1 Tax=Neptunomonas phycophila TaxID=1572645 RepID=A0AAW7XFU2_9GAMM|nr:diacylglycerol kinase [Neptunomonas phycophila]MDO6453134.1 diacylglycerol kinase [Neptunomonas phycophila]
MTPDTDIPPYTGLKRIYKATFFSLNGLKLAWRSEAAFRQDFVLFVAGAAVACWLDVASVERALMILVLGLVLITELLNSAVEACVDRIGLEYHPMSGVAKDIGSAAVFASLLLTAVVWAVILIP